MKKHVPKYFGKNPLSYNDTWNTRHPVQPNTSAHRQAYKICSLQWAILNRKTQRRILLSLKYRDWAQRQKNAEERKPACKFSAKQKHWRMFRLAIMWYLNRENTWKMVWKIAQSFSKRNESDWNDGRAPALNLAIIRQLINNALNKHSAKIKKSTKPRFNNFSH